MFDDLKVSENLFGATEEIAVIFLSAGDGEFDQSVRLFASVQVISKVSNNMLTLLNVFFGKHEKIIAWTRFDSISQPYLRLTQFYGLKKRCEKSTFGKNK